MKKILAILMFVSMPMSAFANSTLATVVAVEPQYRYVDVSVPKETCSLIEVPIYGQGPASSGDALLGAIIGGAIGNQFGNGSGKDAMTVLGAIVGADAANKNGGQQVVGFRTERQCNVVYVNERRREIKNYNITFDYNGAIGQATTNRSYNVGDRVRVSLTLSQ